MHGKNVTKAKVIHLILIYSVSTEQEKSIATIIVMFQI